MLTVNHLTLSVRRQPLLREVAFSVAPGEVLTLMGPSGSGKSTLFAWMIGALSGDFRARGELWLNERRCDTLPTEHRRIGILFQDPLLFDHFSVGQNLQLALPENVRGEARKTAVEEALSRAGLAGFAPRDPATLSGGQRARVSLLRALLARPEALLLDEPFSRLDASLRAGFRRWVFEELARQAIPGDPGDPRSRGLPADGALPGDGALAMKDNSVQTCVTAKKSAPGEWRIRPPLFTVGHFDETCFSIDRTRPAHGACCFHYLRR